MRWRRLRTWAKWACTVAAGAAVALAVFSRFYGWSYDITTDLGDTHRSIGVATGLVWVLRVDGPRNVLVPPPSRWKMWRASYWYWGYAGEKGPSGSETFFRLHAGVMCWSQPSRSLVGASVLYPIALSLVPAALLWYADRRRHGPGSCTKCGYDRRGLAAGVKCPECGTVPTK